MKDEKTSTQLQVPKERHHIASYQDRINNVSISHDEVPSSTSSTYKEINLDEIRNNTQSIKKRLSRLVESAQRAQEFVDNKANMYKCRNHSPNSKRLPLPLAQSDFVEDQLDDENESVLELTKEDFIQMALHYKSLCNVYKKELAQSQKTVRDLHFKIENLEKQNKHLTMRNLKLNNHELIEFRNSAIKTSDVKTTMTMDRFRAYCDKINKYSKMSHQSDSGCISNERGGEEFNESEIDDKDRNLISAEKTLKTLQFILKERKEIRNFMGSFKLLIQYLNPTLPELKSIQSSSLINFSQMTLLTNETLKRLNTSSAVNFKCKCRQTFEFDSPHIKNKSRSRTSRVSSSSPERSERRNFSLHKPSEQFMCEFFIQFLNLFDVECYLNASTRLNDLYYKHGRLMNFKKAIQNIFDPSANYTNEKLVLCVQTLHDQLNQNLTDNLKKMLNSNNLDKVVDKYKIYDEYFPIFYSQIEEIMDILGISQFDQIIPAIQELKL